MEYLVRINGRITISATSFADVLDQYEIDFDHADVSVDGNAVDNIETAEQLFRDINTILINAGERHLTARLSCAI